jgi:hypothetical protein
VPPGYASTAACPEGATGISLAGWPGEEAVRKGVMGEGLRVSQSEVCEGARREKRVARSAADVEVLAELDSPEGGRAAYVSGGLHIPRDLT